MPDTKNILPGQSFFGNGPYTIEEVTNNVVIVFRVPENLWYGVMNMDIQDAPRAHELIDDFLQNYLKAFDLESGVTPGSIEAIVIGGEFRQNIITDDGIIVEAQPYHLARRKTEEALRAYGIRANYMETDDRAEKKVTVGCAGDVCYTATRKGINAQEPTMSLKTYQDLLERKRD